jgi:NAD(P)-dependent dehydrogenase (short-subunit alcohol dehydrogenase family)
VADVDTINASGFNMTGPYAISKAAANLAIAMYSATYSKEGLLFMSISPGVVDTGHALSFTPIQMEGAGRMFAKFEEMKPGFKPLSPEKSVQMCLDVAYKANVDKGDGGSFVSHHGNKDWL